MTANHPPDNVDRWFTAYFQAQLPKPFPAAPNMAVAEPAQPRHATANRTGRLTLAASVAALLAIGVSLSYGPTAGSNSDGSGLLNDATANGKKLKDHMPPPEMPKLP